MRKTSESPNAIAETCGGRIRDGCLNQHWFRDVAEPQTTIGDHREDYTNRRGRSLAAEGESHA